MIKVVSSVICPFVQRVTALLEAKKIPYKIEFINLSDKPQWFLDISPNGQVPVLINENGKALFESDAIAEYIEEVYPASEPAVDAEQRAINRAWSCLATKNYMVQCSAQRSEDAETLQERAQKLDQAFTRIEKVLTDTTFFNGESLNMVDIAWLPLLHRAAIIKQHSGYDFLNAYPKLKQWQSNLMATGLAEKSVSEDFEGIFTSFYLADTTYLGRLSRGEAGHCHGD